MFILRQIHRESGTVTNFLIGDLYHVDPDSKKYYPEMKYSVPILIGVGDFRHTLHHEDNDFYIMTESGQTFERLRPDGSFVAPST